MADLNKTATKETTAKEATAKKVKVVNGVGNDAVSFTYTAGDTVASILKKANIKVDRYDTVTLGRKRIRHPEKTPVQPGDTLVIATKVSNG